ncbi:uncharacterized protein RAG0_17082 [Rhynchosporium agropyri]|uniref:Uncharacterized protein n=1 Tax=Rhynchosporium agropyri TaxID=914238 RepID=A0A1E1LSV5_9HELO|nr:uncharacterized protein RAG0_17082 [Rhynchosporium agropyri]
MSSQSFAGKTVSKSSDSWAITKSSFGSNSNDLRFPMDTCSQPAIEIFHRIRCAKCVKAIKRGSEFDTTDRLRVDDVDAFGMDGCIHCDPTMKVTTRGRLPGRKYQTSEESSKKYEVLREP